MSILIRQLRWISFVEGLSTLALFLVAMPLKYIAGKPETVTIVGRLHGGLVLIFALSLLVVMLVRRWKVGYAAKLFAASLVPFGFLWIEAKLKREP